MHSSIASPLPNEEFLDAVGEYAHALAFIHDVPLAYVFVGTDGAACAVSVSANLETYRGMERARAIEVLRSMADSLELQASE